MAKHKPARITKIHIARLNTIESTSHIQPSIPKKRAIPKAIAANISIPCPYKLSESQITSQRCKSLTGANYTTVWAKSKENPGETELNDTHENLRRRTWSPGRCGPWFRPSNCRRCSAKRRRGERDSHNHNQRDSNCLSIPTHCLPYRTLHNHKYQSCQQR